ncbi:MAG: NAD-dependent epimerase/dehydratase family protein [Chloroflexi bacterium]|nr:NAD-dependent epimerase/dehydratase family protein [Chloroflexota bacterium]
MTVLVTGATGFIGNHVAQALLRHGQSVRCLVRPELPLHPRAALPDGAEQVAGDLLDGPSLHRATDGCEAVFHVAAMYELWAPDPGAFYRVNVDGTRLVLESARAAGASVVFTSSVSTIPPGGDERDFSQPSTIHSHYKRSKILAERLVLAHPGAIVVNPSTPIGRGDARPTPTGKIVLDFLRGRMPAFVDTGLNLVDVEDVAEGHILAWRRGRPGQRYILGNANLTLQAMLNILARQSGRPAPRVRLPLAAAYATGALSEIFEGRLLGRTPAVPFEAVRMAATPMYYDASKARTELGLPQTPVSTALRKAAQWFLTNGYC